MRGHSPPMIGMTFAGMKEPVLGDMPAPRGQTVSAHCFVDSDHAANNVTRRPQTGLLVFVNRAPVTWFSKRQNTFKMSTFGSEFIAMKTAVEHVEALRYKLRMFGIPMEGPTNVFCDNEAVFKNTSILNSTLKKKHMTICYHRPKEAVTAHTMRVAKEGTATHLVDLFTKPLMDSRRAFLLDRLTYYWEWVFTLPQGFPLPPILGHIGTVLVDRLRRSG